MTELIVVCLAGLLVGLVIGALLDRWWSRRSRKPLIPAPITLSEAGHRHQKPSFPIKEHGHTRIYQCECGDRIFMRVLESGTEVPL